MKKLLSILLLVTLTLSLFGCTANDPNPSTEVPASTGTSAQGATGKFMVGLGRADITPRESVPLAGYGNTAMRMSTGFLDFLYTTCVAFTDAEGNTVLLFNNDLINTNATVADAARSSIAGTLGLSVDNVLISATHTHSGPDQGSNLPSIQRYRAYLIQRMKEAALAAMEDRKPAEMYIASGEVLNLNFVRHYIMNDGSYVGDNFGDASGKTYVKHTSEADHILQLVKFTREGGEDILLSNWQQHQTEVGGTKGNRYDISADIAGYYRSILEAKLNCKLAYFTGASGNVNPTSRIPAEKLYDNHDVIGTKLAEGAMEVAKNFQKAETGKVQALGQVYAGKVNHSEDDKIIHARLIADLFAEQNNASLCMKEGRQYGINSAYHANGILSKATLGETYDVDMNAFAIGDVGFITAPYEMFDTNGVEIKEGSPFKMTFVVTCANGAIGYIPSALGYSHGCYGADTGKFEAGTGEILAQEYVKMLTKLYETK